MKYPKILLLLFCALSIAGCAQIDKKIETIKPTAKLVDTRLANINFNQADLVFDLAVTNKNPFSIHLVDLDYDFKIAGYSLLNGVTGQGLKLKKSSTSRISLPVTLKFDDLRKIPGELWRKDVVDYRLDSKINIKLPVIGNYAVPFSKIGELPVPRLPSIRLQDITVKSLGLTTAEIVALVEVTNPNTFNIELNEFNYRLKINQSQWGEGASVNPTTIPSKNIGAIELPLTLDLLGLGKSAFQLLSSGDPLNYQLTGDVKLDTGLEHLRRYKMPLNISGRAAF